MITKVFIIGETATRLADDMEAEQGVIDFNHPDIISSTLIKQFNNQTEVNIFMQGIDVGLGNNDFRVLS